MNNFVFEKKKLLAHLNNPELVNLLKTSKCFIAGGAITSLFSGKEINDIDVYFKDYDSLILVLKNLFNYSGLEDREYFDLSSFSLIYTNHTKKSILFTKDGLNLQLIYFKFFNEAKDIFNTFDFTINMGAYDCAKEEFTFHDDFFKDVAQRRLNVNPDTSFPIISLLRIDKYKQRGYQISRKDFINLCLAVNRLEINTWENLADAIGGMYGYAYTDLFDTKKEFSIDEAINQLLKLEVALEDKAFTPTSIDYYGLIDQVNIALKIIPKPEDRIFYKKVVRTELPDVFASFHYKNFKYKLTDMVNGGVNGIWVYKTIREAKNHFISSDKSKTAILSIRASDLAKIDRDCGCALKIIGDAQVLEEIIP